MRLTRKNLTDRQLGSGDAKSHCNHPLNESTSFTATILSVALRLSNVITLADVNLAYSAVVGDFTPNQASSARLRGPKVSINRFGQ